MTPDDQCLTARNFLYSAIHNLQTQADISREEALVLITGYAVELTAFLLNDSEKIRELCEDAARDGIAARQNPGAPWNRIENPADL